MNNVAQLLLLRAKQLKPFELTISGESMLPILHDGDIITVCRKENYVPGDILVFIYKHGEVLAHRLLKIESERYFCKGDNSLRLEDIGAAQIIGSITIKDDPHRCSVFLNASYQINRIFRRCHYNAEQTKQTLEYQTYRKTYLRSSMKYIINPNMEFLDIDDGNLAVYDSVNGDTHYITSTGKDILQLLKDDITEQELIAHLCELYDAPVEQITEDVLAFLKELSDKKVLMCQ